MSAADAKDRVTNVLLEMEARGERSDPRLDPLLYEELRRIAGDIMRGERAAHTLQATALVNEAWMRLVDSTRVQAASRAVFLGLAARTMRRVLVDHARARGRQKRGAQWQRVTLSGITPNPDGQAYDLVALDEALASLQALDERQALIVEMRFFAGMSVKDVAQVLNISETVVRTDWYTARAWLAARFPN